MSKNTKNINNVDACLRVSCLNYFERFHLSHFLNIFNLTPILLGNHFYLLFLYSYIFSPFINRINVSLTMSFRMYYDFENWILSSKQVWQRKCLSSNILVRIITFLNQIKLCLLQIEVRNALF